MQHSELWHSVSPAPDSQQSSLAVQEYPTFLQPPAPWGLTVLAKAGRAKNVEISGAASTAFITPPRTSSRRVSPRVREQLDIVFFVREVSQLDPSGDRLPGID